MTVGPHPRFPDHMPPDVREAIGDELNVTLSGYPHRLASPAHLLTAYAEQLEGFAVTDIREGFRIARHRAERFAPNPTDLRKAVAEVARERLALGRRAQRMPDQAPLDPDEIPDWRAALGPMLDCIGHGGQPPEPAA